MIMCERDLRLRVALHSARTSRMRQIMKAQRHSPAIAHAVHFAEKNCSPQEGGGLNHTAHCNSQQKQSKQPATESYLAVAEGGRTVTDGG